MKPAEILIIPAWYNHKNAYEGIFIHQFCEALVRNGFSVTLLYIRVFTITRLFEYLKKSLFSFSYNYNVIEIRGLKLPFWQSNNSFLYSLTNKVYRKIKQTKPNIIHIQSVCNNVTPFIGWQVANRLNKPYVITEHYTSFSEAKGILFKPFLTETLVKKVVSEANGRVAVSKYAGGLFENYFGSKFVAIPNIIGASFITETFVPLNTSKPFKFIVVGGITERKGILNLIQAFINLEQTTPGIELNIVGDGDQKTEAKSMIEANGMGHKIFLNGRKPEKEIIKMIDASHCMVSASGQETFGLVIAESLLRGRPVIAVDSGAVNELITTNNGILCNNVNTVNALTNAMTAMINNYGNYHAEDIRKDALKKFNELAIIKQYETIYNAALAQLKN